MKDLTPYVLRMFPDNKQNAERPRPLLAYQQVRRLLNDFHERSILPVTINP